MGLPGMDCPASRDEKTVLACWSRLLLGQCHHPFHLYASSRLFIDHGLPALFTSYIVGIIGAVSIGGRSCGAYYRIDWKGSDLHDRHYILHTEHDHTDLFQLLSFSG